MAVALAAALAFRALPHWRTHGTLGVDHWYWKSYIETYRRDRQFPPFLPQYLLDEQQWYPPVFPLLLAALPGAVFIRYGFWVSVGVDLIRLTLLLCAVAWLTADNLIAVAVSGLVYATTPILISYNSQLNPRGLGALFLDCLWLLLIWKLQFGSPAWLWGLIVGMGALILLTHKMTTQLFWFLCLAGGLVFQEWRLLALIPASVLTALAVSRSFYWKVMRAHWDIVRFWHRNWRWLQAHLIKESPIYGTDGYETPTKFHRQGLGGMIQHLKYLAGFFPGAWVLAAAWLIGMVSFNSAATSIWVVEWMVATLTFALLTVFIPQLKCLGSGYYYLYNAAFPVSLLSGLLLIGTRWPSPEWSVVTAALLANLAGALLYYRKLRSRPSQSAQEFGDVIAYLKTLPKGNVMCLPLQQSEVVACQTEHSVLWGAHGYGFQLIEPIFPRLLLPIQEIIRRYRVRYLVTQDSYVTEDFLKNVTSDSVMMFRGYRVFLTES